MTDEITYDITLEREADGRIAWLRFESDHRMNVLTLPMLERMLALIEEAGSDPELRVLGVTGRPEVFSGGADLEFMRSLGDDAYRAYIMTEYELFRTLETLPCITIAALAGPCIGNAAEMALACDFRICTPKLRFGYPELIVGFVAPAQRLTAYVGIGRAKELLYEGKLLSADEALSLGIVTSIAEGDLGAAASEAAERYARIAPVALPLTKAGISRCYGTPGQFDGFETSAAFATFKSEDFQEGASAALERRKPEFAGR
jgi:enoyl-CoA hydratase/carnithine racemase